MDTYTGLTDTKYHVIAGRTGIVVGLLVFIATYLYGLLQFGWVLGLALGWLPCGLLAWLATVGTDMAVLSLLRSTTLLQPSSSAESN
jgi:hypothetical protein